MVTNPSASIEAVRSRRRRPELSARTGELSAAVPEIEGQSYSDPRDEFLRSVAPVSVHALATRWHRAGVRDGYSYANLLRRCEAEGWVAAREQGGVCSADEGVASGNADCHQVDGRAVWMRCVTPRLPDILEALVSEATDGKLPAIQLILKYEGLLDYEPSASDADDQYPVIVGLCCDPVG